MPQGAPRDGFTVSSPTTSDSSSLGDFVIEFLFEKIVGRNETDPFKAAFRLWFASTLSWAMALMIVWAIIELWDRSSKQHGATKGHRSDKESGNQSEKEGAQFSQGRTSLAESRDNVVGPSQVESRTPTNSNRPQINIEENEQHEIDPSIETKGDLEDYEDVFKLDLPYFEAYMRKNRFERSRSGKKHVTITEERKVTIKTPHATGRASTTIADAIVDRRHSS